MKRWIIIAVICGVALLFALPVRAQGETCSVFEQSFTVPDAFPLEEDSDVWEITPETNGILVSLDPEGDGGVVDSTAGTSSGVLFILRLSGPIDIDHISYDVSAPFGSATSYVNLCDDVDCMSSTRILNNPAAATPFTAEDDTGYTDIDAVKIVVATVGTGNDVTFDNLEINGQLAGCLFRPVRSDDVVDEVAVDNDYGLTTTAGARAFAVDDATVVSVVLHPDGYTVGLLVNGIDLVVYVGLGAVFGDVGDEVEGGCVLGYAGDTGPGQQLGTGFVFYHHDPDLGDWHEFGESLSETPCNQPDSNCINPNPDFNNASAGWLTRNAPAANFPAIDGGGLTIPKGGQIYQPGFPVEQDETYYVTVVVTLPVVEANAQLTIDFAGTASTLNLVRSGSAYQTLTTQALSPAFAGETELRLTNTTGGGVSHILITFACLHAGDVIVAPPPCYFEDAELFSDTFETEGGATFETSPLGLGRYSLPVGGIIRSPVDISAFSDAATDFTLKINGAAPAGATEVTASIVDADDDSELQAIGVFEYSSLLWANIQRGFTLSAAEHVVGDIYIENTGSETVLISSLCMSSDVGVWPGYENPDYANGSLLPTSCESCDFPDTLTDVVAWLGWLGCVLRYLIYCLLYTLVNNIWATIIAVGSGLALLGRWLGAAISLVVAWLWTAGGRLLASLLGNAIPILNAILAWILSLPFVRDVLDAATIAALWIDGIILFIVGVINLFVSAVRFVGVLVALVGSVWVAFITGLSTASAISVPLPDCYDSGSTFYDVCLLLDVLNFMVAQVTAIAFLFGAVAISILWAAGRQIKDEIERVFES